MDMKYKDGSMNTDDQIVGLLIALLFAGQHSSTTAATWTTILSTRYKCIQIPRTDFPGRILRSMFLLSVVTFLCHTSYCRGRHD